MVHFRNACALVLIVSTAAACGGSDSASTAATTLAAGAATAPADGVTTTTVLSATASPSSAGATTTEVSTTAVPSTTGAPSTNSLPSGGIDECIVAPWIQGSDQLENLFTDTAISRIPGASFSLSGQATIDFAADGTYKYTPEFSMDMTIADQDASGQWSGAQTGLWKVVGDMLTISNDVNTITGTMTLFGQTQPLPPIDFREGTSRIVKCDVATLKLETDTPGGPFTQTLVIGEYPTG
jgi:hypothetical protein